MTNEIFVNAFSLKNKVALVTGAAKGFGKFFSQTLAEAGADLVCVDYDPDPLKEGVKILEQMGTNVLALVVDVSLIEAVKRMLNDTVAKFGRLDIAVNNAGIVTKPSRFHDISLEDWNRLMSIDLTGVFLCMQEELKVMVRQKSGVIINIASVAGLLGVEPELMPRANYVAAKHGVIGLTKQAALEYAQDNIRVNAIAPGWFSGTDIGRQRTTSRPASDDVSLKKKRIELIPLRRTGNINELKGLLLYLASDASSYVTGQVHIIDGGVTVH